MEASKSADDIIGSLRRTQESGAAGSPEPQDFRGVKFTGADLSGLDLSGGDFSGCEMSRCDLSGARCPSANFDGATLYQAKLDGAEFLGSTFREANLTECSALKAGFGMADLSGANFFNAKLEDSTFVDSEFRGADLRAAKMARCRLLEADLEQADFSQADLTDVDLCETDINGANFRRTTLRGSHLRDVRNYTKADWIGADIRDIDFTGAYLLRQHIIDENYLHEFKNQSRATRYVYYFWKLTSDCGRSLTRWGLFLSATAVFFALIYWAMDQWPPAGMESHLKGIGGEGGIHDGFIAYLYYSVVTFTTLGYGDVSPVSVAGQIVLIIHIAIGYLGLGALLSILATKFASRGH
ncbi:MAG: pentapeptide repeat-containing protein [Pedosphaera sp.]|nr:pentapeptide repeat-containing protein [Pedosphaera sp.]